MSTFPSRNIVAVWNSLGTVMLPVAENVRPLGRIALRPRLSLWRLPEPASEVLPASDEHQPFGNMVAV